jgi:hypothetical protein
VLDAAEDMLAGRVSYSKGLAAIITQQWTGGLPARDRDMAGLYAVDAQRDAWTPADELSHFEAFARLHAAEDDFIQRTASRFFLITPSRARARRGRQK